MSWRQILGVSKPEGLDQTHNTQNTHKTILNGVSANNEDSVRDESKLMEALSLACSNCSINAMDFYKRLTQEDVQEWFDGKLSVEDLTVAARSFEQQDAMLRGEVPDNYIYHANCKGCGPVWLWYSKEVLFTKSWDYASLAEV